MENNAIVMQFTYITIVNIIKARMMEATCIIVVIS